MNNSPSNIFQKMLSLERYGKICLACFGHSKCEWVKESSRHEWVPLEIEVWIFDTIDYHLGSKA